ncbi:MAG TPA: hypothetical protein VNT99_09045 [Methylomirabilota bacterium]|nr:hypothetical protein [Methylomirabilota bacterium]
MSKNRTKQKINWLTNELLKYCGPIFVTPSIDSYPAEMDAGTYALINTGTKHLLVTCCHVWDEYERQHDKDERAVLAINLGEGDCIAFNNPLAHRLDIDRDLDLVALEFGPEGIAVPHNKSWFKISDWPIPRSGKGEYIVTLGFPKARRKTGGTNVTFGCAALPFAITDTNDRSIAVFCDEENKQVLNDVKDCLAGISGSPAYRLTEKGELRLVGFAKSGSLESNASERTYRALADSPLGAHVSFTHASYLRQDGTFSR